MEAGNVTTQFVAVAATPTNLHFYEREPCTKYRGGVQDLLFAFQ